MDIDEMERLARIGDVSAEAVGHRLRASRLSLQPKVSQREMASRMKQAHATYATWEQGGAYPQVQALRHLFRHHRLDFNWHYYGNFAQLPGDVQGALYTALRALETTPGRRSNSD